MATTGTTALSNEVKALYDADYLLAGQSNLYWDQLANLRMQMDGQRGISYNFPIVESLQPATGPLDELADVVPQQMRANEVVVTLQEFGGAVEVTKFAEATVYSDVYEQAAYANGYGMAESIDMIVRAVAGQGSRRWFQNARTARSQINGTATAADQITVKWLELLSGIAARGVKMPLYEDGSVCTVLHPFVWYDLLQQQSVRDMSIRLAPELLFNGELAYWGGVRMIVSSNAKGFWGAGASGTVATTLATAGNVGDTTIYYTGGSPAVGMWLNIVDGAEPANVWTDTNELFYVTTVGTSGTQASGATGLTGFCLDPGPGDGGGLRYAHASGTTLNNANSVFPITVLGPHSLTKAASDLTGPYGETVVTGPFDRLGRFINLGWYLIAGWGRTRNAWLFRGECGSSQT